MVVKGASCRKEEKEEVKISHGIDRDKRKEIKRRGGKLEGIGTTACLWRDVGPF